MPSDLILKPDAFIRSVAINKATPYALFLGAGASISSGVPSATSCIWEWKRSIFLSKNPGLEAQFAELSLPSVKAKIQQWLNRQNKYPAEESPEEYGFYIQECYPIAGDRKAFFQDKIRQARPHIGYRLMIKLAEVGLIHSVWTTNFDGLAAKAASISRDVISIEVGIDCQERLIRTPNRNELLCVSMHGDYRYDNLKNTNQELQTQETALQAALVKQLKDMPLIVIGYSGRDDSIISALEEVYSESGSGLMYWCGYGDADVPDRIRGLIEKARSVGRSAFYIPSAGFDDLMQRLFLFSSDGVTDAESRQLLAANELGPTDIKANFSLPDLPTSGVIKSNAFALTPPGEIYEFDLNKWPIQGKVWEYFNNCTDNKKVVAAPFKGKGYAFGLIEDIQSIFGENIKEKIDRVPINDVDLRYEDSVINSLILRALVRAITESAGVCSDGKEFLWDKNVRERISEQGENLLVHDAVLIYLRRIAGKSFVVLKPTVKIESATGGEVTVDVERKLKMRILGWQHNKEFNQAVDIWRTRLFAQETFEFPNNCSSLFRFHVRRTPEFAKVCSQDLNKRIQLNDKYQRSINQNGVELEEPTLLFSNREGSTWVKDTHPVRGIVQNQPFDYPLTSHQIVSEIKVGVICPSQEANRLSNYLQGFHSSIQPGKYEADYLPPYTGFQSAFGTGLKLPGPGDNLWSVCPEINPNVSQEQGALQLSSNINTCLSALRSSSAPNIIIIFIPTRWAKWRSFETAVEKFDVHDFVKAFCIPQGIATQFLEEDTFTNDLQCRIRWWLSLALYVKSMRTPWVLASMDTDSAFVGLGISLDRKALKGHQVILGCSHLYNAQGEGLQFRLSKIENPVIRRRNAFMSYDDARRFGETIRQLFYESKFRLPRRVVVHKLTPFTNDEKKGLQAGLDGVKEIELLEIHVDDALRYLSSIPQRSGGFKEDGYPVRRGTLLKLDNNSALLWVHGVSRALNPRLNYYQGKRRVPAPLVIIRHAGKSDLTTIGAEILGLSKMNWNSFDLYTKLPATVESSRQIAKIGSLMERFGSTSYDYRLFM